jgi:hypothetical protein
MSTLNDVELGELSWDLAWVRPLQCELFGARHTLQLVIVAYDESPPLDIQRQAFAHFLQRAPSIVSEVETELLHYYLNNLEEWREQFGDTADQLAPYASSAADLSRLLRPTHLLVCDPFDSSDRIVGFLFDCSWDIEHGVGVKIVNEQVVEVGPQDILL